MHALCLAWSLFAAQAFADAEAAIFERYHRLTLDRRGVDLTEDEYRFINDHMSHVIGGDGLRNFRAREMEAIDPRNRRDYQGSY